MEQRVDIRPGVSVLSVLRHLNYTYWHALAEFVDNAIQSHMANRELLKQLDSSSTPLRVEINLTPQDGGVITVRDYAAGISSSDFPRAFKPAAIPFDRSGLSEFGMGMKSAACWCAREWSVRTKPLDEPVEYHIHFNIEEIVSGDLNELRVDETPLNAGQETTHYTEIRLQGLHKIPAGRTVSKIKQHLADIYREFFRKGELVLTFDDVPLSYEEPKVLIAPFFKDESGPAREWRIPLDFDFGTGLRAHGFAAIRDRASTSRAGFALFRRGRVIQGSGDAGYRPEKIFGKSNSFIYQRVFGGCILKGLRSRTLRMGLSGTKMKRPFWTS